MVRTTEDYVRSKIDNDPDLPIKHHIETASVLVDDIVTNASDLGITITAARLREIETYLAAHFYALLDLQPMEEETGRGKIKYEGETGKYFELTRHGQMAIAMDPTDTLKSGPQVTVTWAGTERSDE